MKVLMLHNDYLQAGGERVSVATEIQALRDAGVEVATLLVGNESLAERNVVSKALSTFPSRPLRSSVLDSIRENEPNLIHAQNLFPQLGAGAISAFQQSGIPWVRTIRNYRKGCIAGTFTRDGAPCTDCLGNLGRLPGIAHSCYQGSKGASVGAANYAFWDGLAESRYPPSAYIAISRAAARIIGPALQDHVRTEVVYNAVSVQAQSSFVPPKDRRFDAAFLGRFSEEKGVRIALACAKSLPNVSFVFAGGGELEDEVVSAEGMPNVTYLRGLNGAEAFNLMGESRVVLVPSQWEEPFGRVAAEALAAGAIPLVSDIGGLPEVVDTLDAVHLVRSFNDVESWRKTLTNILAGTERMQYLSGRGIERWRLTFSAGASARNLIEIYESVLAC